MERFVDNSKQYMIDAIEVGEDFLTLYMATHESGTEESRHLKFIRTLSDIIPDPFHHDPSRFHPDGQDWRKPFRAFQCHFHFLMDPTNESIKQWLNRIERDSEGVLLNPELKKEIEDFYK